jgi:hypothetical protein
MHWHTCNYLSFVWHRDEPMLTWNLATALQVQAATAAKSLPASPAKAYTAADVLQPATPPQLAPRRRTAHGSSGSE